MNINNNLSNIKFIKIPDDKNIREPLSPLSSIDQTLEEEGDHVTMCQTIFLDLAPVLQSSYGVAKNTPKRLQFTAECHTLSQYSLVTSSSYWNMLSASYGFG